MTEFVAFSSEDTVFCVLTGHKGGDVNCHKEHVVKR